MNGGGIAAMAVKPGRIAPEAQNSMLGSGILLSSPCEALGLVCEGVDMTARKRRVASDDAVWTEEGAMMGESDDASFPARLWQRRSGMALDAALRALAEAAYLYALADMEHRAPALMMTDGTLISRQGRERPNAFRRQHGPSRQIDRYRERGSITQRQYEAADKLWCDLMRAGLAPKVTANLMGAGGGGEATHGMAITLGQLDARRRIRVAADRLGRRLWGVLQAVVWDEMAASAWAGGYGIEDRRDARTSGVMALRLALDSLADYYRLPNGD